MSFKLYTEILKEFEDAPTRKEKIEILRKNFTPRFGEFLQLAFAEDVKFDVELPTAYKVNVEPVGMTMTTLHIEMAKLYRFIEGHPKRIAGLSGKKQQNLFIGILESLHKDEAELLIRVVKKNLGVKFLTANLLKEAYPGINL
jgi:intracellular sulfur oxidation DsrE/DsrF family protein